MTPFTQADIVSAASSASVPPALLMGMVRQAGVSGTLNLPDATIQAYGITDAEMQKDPQLILTLAARVLAEQFKKTGDWQSALAKTISGDATQAQSATSSTGGMVQAIIGWAATQPNYGFDTYQPLNAEIFNQMSTAFTQELTDLASMGGVVDKGTAKRYAQDAQGVMNIMKGVGNIPFRPSASLSQAMTDVLTTAQIPVTHANLAFLETMARGEGMDPSTYNWLASTQGAGQNFNSVGVKVYDSYQEGVANTAATLLNGNYDRMVQLMRQGADLHTLAGDPQVQRNLETWQGGSHEDVKNLLKLANIPGTPIQQPGQGPSDDAKNAVAGPDEVGQFAQQMQANNIDPDVFNEHFAWLAAQRRRLLGEKATSLEDFRPVAGMTRDQMLTHLMAQPHSQYPGVTVGQMSKARSQAELLGVLHTGRMPSQAEVARFAQADLGWQQINGYYEDQQAKKNPNLPQQAGRGNVVNMPQPGQQNQEQGKIKQMERSA